MVGLFISFFLSSETNSAVCSIGTDSTYAMLRFFQVPVLRDSISNLDQSINQQTNQSRHAPSLGTMKKIYISTYPKSPRHNLTQPNQHPRPHALVLSQDPRSGRMHEEVRLRLKENMIRRCVAHQPTNQVLAQVQPPRQLLHGSSVTREVLKDPETGQGEGAHGWIALGV